MRAHILLSMALILVCTSVQAQTQRNPAGSGALGGPTRNATGTSSTPASKPAAAGSATPSAGNAAPTRPPEGAGVHPPLRDAGTNRTLPGSGGTGLSTGGPSVLTPRAATGVRPNGATSENGSKPAPMQANGVRKVD